jgi:hypothetical protein
MNFKGMPQADVPQGRDGKHKGIVTRILADLDQLRKGVALKVPLAELTDSKEKVRSALNRATRKGGRNVATASDGTYLYVWNETPQGRLPVARVGARGSLERRKGPLQGPQ